MTIDDTQRAALDILFDTDAYKLDHRRQYPPGTEFVHSNLTARGSRIDGVEETVFFGLQAYLHQVLDDQWAPFFAADVDEVCDAYERQVTAVLGPNDVGSQHIRDLHALGYLPLRIRALPEGSLVPLRVPYLTIENTVAEFFWLTNYLETSISAHLWQPITSATTAWHNRLLLDARAEASSSKPGAVDFQGHDFSSRGMANTAAAAASGAGHLLSFRGTDTLPALRYVDRFYPGSPADELIGGSVPATEHSVMCAGGVDGEIDTFTALLDLYPRGILSVVSDTWNLWTVLHDYLPRLRERILARDGTLVIRPDSGDPERILCGDPEAPEGSPERLGVIPALWNLFGGTVNDKGYRELDSHIGTIYGDSITHDRAASITANLMSQGYASTIPVFGFGSYTYQYVSRDTFKMAVKATWVRIDGVGRDIAKDPITDDGAKKSATGRLAVHRGADGSLILIERATPEQEAAGVMQTVFEDGKVPTPVSFSQVRRQLRSDDERRAHRG